MSAQTSSDTTDTSDALALLPVPDLDGLSDAQTRGRDCVWCGIALTPATAFGLGEHMSPLSGTISPMRWFPRSCRNCAHHYAFAALHDHAPRCEQCVDNADQCPAGVGLRRIMRDTRS